VRKWIIPLVLGILAIGAVALWGNTQRLANRNTEIFLDNKYQRAFFDLTNQVQNLEVLLSKSMVVADPRLDLSLLMDLRQQAAFAQSNLSQLPLGDALASRTSKFLTQVGDYGDSLARQVSRGEAINKDQWDSLNNLYRQSVDLNRELQGMSYKVAQNNFYFSELVAGGV
jgi:spore germination protein